MGLSLPSLELIHVYLPFRKRKDRFFGRDLFSITGDIHSDHNKPQCTLFMVADH